MVLKTATEQILGLAFFLACGVICWLIARQKGRTWAWFFAGFCLHIIGIIMVSVASDLRAEESTRRLLDDMREKISRLEFEANTTAGSATDVPLCDTCSHSRSRYRICSALGYPMTAPVVKCSKYAPNA